MKKISLWLLVAAATVIASPPSWAQERPQHGPPISTDRMEAYWACVERHDLDAIQDLIWYHHNVERIDATIYGLPRDDFDDTSSLTIDERLKIRAEKAALGEDLAVSGSLQYPHHLREALDNYYLKGGARRECAELLGGGHGNPPDPKTLASGWVSDANLTTFDLYDRGEVDLVIDYANPNRIIASSVSSGSGVEGSSDLILYSADYGKTWGRRGVGNNSGTSWECDPVTYYQRSTGRAYHSKIGCTTGTCGTTQVHMRYSTNNGADWADCTRPSSDKSEDRQWHVVDNTPQYDSTGDGIPDTANPCYGNIYLTWHNSNQEKVIRSTDNCVSWNSLTNLTGTYSAITPDINVAADGHAFVVWQNYGDDTFKIAGSSSCGATWASPAPKTIKPRLADWKNFLQAQCARGVSSLPTVDVDRCPWSDFYGRLYVAMFDFDRTGCDTATGCASVRAWDDTCNYEIWFTYSDDNGASFATPVPITAGDGNQVDNFMGYMRVDEKDGSIYIAHHRTTLNPQNVGDRQKTHYVVLRSIDGGDTWEEFQASTILGDERSGTPSTFERGDYNRIDVYNGVVYPVWVDRRGLTDTTEEVLTRKICTEPSHRVERSPSFSQPTTDVTSPGGGLVDISWDAPDVYWGDGDEDPTQRYYQLWVDGALVQDGIAWTTTTIASYDPGDCESHTYFVRAYNQCGIAKDYSTTAFSATGCCVGNPSSVSVTPAGPLELCDGASQTLTANTTGGTPPFTYQWYRDGGAISGAQSATYDAADSGTHAYTCNVTGSGCSTGISDSSPTQISWQTEPQFTGLSSVSNDEASTCSLTLTWDAGSTACAGPLVYNIYRSESSGFSPGAGTLIAANQSCGGSPCSYSDTNGLVAGTPYYYVVRAKDQTTGVEEGNTIEVGNTPTGAASQAWADDFESGNTGWTFTTGTPAATAGFFVIGDPVGTVGNYGDASQPEDDHTPSPGVNCLYSAVNTADAAGVDDIDGGEVVATSPTFDGSGYVSLHLSLWRWFFNEDDDSASGNNDYYILEVSNNNGTSWTQLEYVDETVTTANSWTNSQFDLEDHISLTSTMKIRVRAADDPTVPDLVEVAVDDIVITGYSTCTTGSSCTDPGQPVITQITDDDVCVQNGVTIEFTPGSGASSHDLYVDGSLAQSGFSSGSSYTPVDAASHDYVIRAVDSTCHTDSVAYSFTDAAGAPTAAVVTAVNDADACAATGVRVVYTASPEATSHDLYVDGGLAVSGYVSNALYVPVDNAPHSYMVRALTASCSTDSNAVSGADLNDGVTAPAITGIADADGCAQSGITVSYTPGTGAASHDLLRNGSVVVSGYVSGALYNPGSTGSFDYAVRAVNGSCSADSGAQSFSDTDNGPGTPILTGITDEDGCAQTGIQISYTAAASADRHDLVRDGSTVVVTGYTSGALYNPADTSSHSYLIRAVKGSCEVDSATQSFTDAADPPGAPVISTVTDADNCGFSGIRVFFTGGTGATSHDLVVDGAVEVVGYSSGDLYNPGDADPHDYQVRAVAGLSCFTDSTVQAFADENHSFSFAGIATATDVDACDDSGVTVTWTAPALWDDGGVSTRSFTVLRTGADASGVLVEGATSFNDNGGVNGISYAYSVRATNGYGCTADGGVTLAAADLVGAVPTFSGVDTVDVMPGGACGLRVSWSAASSNCGTGPGITYNVYRDTGAGFTPDPATNLIASCIADLSFDDMTVSGGLDYYYIVRAEDSSVGHGGPCNSGYEDTNSSDLNGILVGASETAVQGGPLTATSGSATVALVNDFTLSTADTATLSFDLDLTGGGGSETLTTPNFTGTANGTDTKQLTPDATIAVAGATATFSYTVTSQRNAVNSALLRHVGNGTSANLPTPSANGTPVVTDVSAFYQANGPGTYEFEVSHANQSVPYINISLAITGSSAGTVTHCTRVELVDPLSSASLLKDYDAAVKASYDVAGIYTGPGTYQLRLSEQCGDQASLSNASMTVQEPDCVQGFPDPVQYFTGRVSSNAVKLEWQNPDQLNDSVWICVSTSAFPSSPEGCTMAASGGGAANAYGSASLTGLGNGTTYFYSAFVKNGLNQFSARQTVAATPFDSSGKLTWAYNSSASALTPTGMWPGPIGTGATYAVSNDRVLHGMNPTTAGGDWPRSGDFSWTPMAMNGPAHARPPVLPTSVVPGATMVLFLGSEDGHAYAANAHTGEELWQSPGLGNMLLASPTGVFQQYGAAYDLLFIGSRDALAENAVYAINPANGASVWSFTNGGGVDAIGIISGTAWADQSTNRLYFTSRAHATGSQNTVWCLSFDGSGASVLWAKPLDDVDGRPYLYDGRVYVGTNTGKVHALDAADGTLYWTYTTTDGAVKNLVLPARTPLPGRMLTFSTTNTVWAIVDQGATVSDAWQRTGIATPSSPLLPVDRSAVYVGSGDGSLYQLDPATGATVTSLVIGDGSAAVGSPALDGANNMCYLGTESGSVYGVVLPLQ